MPDVVVTARPRRLATPHAEDLGVDAGLGSWTGCRSLNRLEGDVSRHRGAVEVMFMMSTCTLALVMSLAAAGAAGGAALREVTVVADAERVDPELELRKSGWVWRPRSARLMVTAERPSA
jgi:hypothetical protein